MNEELIIGVEIKKLNNLIKRRISSLDTQGISPMHGRFIRYMIFQKEHDIYQRDIEKAFTIRRSTATDILKKMEEKGLITRENVDGDHRLKRILLTDKAYCLEEELNGFFKKVEQEMRNDISKSELDTFFKVSMKIEKNLSKEENNL